LSIYLTLMNYVLFAYYMIKFHIGYTSSQAVFFVVVFCELLYILIRSRDISISVMTRLRAGRPQFDSRHRRIFLFATTSRPALEPTQPPVQWIPGSFLGGKAAESWNFKHLRTPFGISALPAYSLPQLYRSQLTRKRSNHNVIKL
jgi:hypothetical protein